MNSIPLAFADHKSVTVSIPAGSSVPGCHETNECFIPSDITINVGSEVIWTNNDNAAHTVTSGSASDGNFDSSLFMVGDTFSVKFDSLGVFPYICKVHPWMIGSVTVSDVSGSSVGGFGGTIAHVTPNDILISLYVESGKGKAEKNLRIDISILNIDKSAVEHVNYDIIAIQGSKFILDKKGVYDYDGIVSHTTTPLPFDATREHPVDVILIFNGFGIDSPFTGPIGEVSRKSFNPFISTSSTPSTTTLTSLPSSASTSRISATSGSSLPGCEENYNCFSPYSVTVNTGTTVTWTNNDNAAHTVTSGSLSTDPDNTGSDFDSSLFVAGTSFEVTFDTAGTYPYFCIVHPWMTGTVIVESGVTVISPSLLIPDWIKVAADWWASDATSQSDFTNAIQYLIKERIIVIPDLQKSGEVTGEAVPDWVKSNARWWAADQISDNEFVNAIQYLIKQGIIKI